MGLARTTAVLAAFAASIGVLDAQNAPIKIATIAPDNSPYVKALRQMGEGWQKRTNGRVRCTVFPGGDSTEQQMLRDMRPEFGGKLHAAQLSAITLGILDDAFNVFGLPMFFESYEEADRVLEEIRPELDRRLTAKHYKALNWAYVGWVRVFSTEPVKTVNDLKKLKLYTSTGDDRLAKWYKANGFIAVPLDSTEIVPSLKTKVIQAVPMPPAFAQLLSIDRSAPYAMDVGFAPLLGATIMAEQRWNALAPGDQAIVLEEAKKTGDDLRRRIPEVEAEAIAVMKSRGLKVVEVDRAEWRRLAEQLGEAMRKDGTVPGDIYDAAKRARDAVRSGRSATR